MYIAEALVMHCCPYLTKRLVVCTIVSWMERTKEKKTTLMSMSMHGVFGLLGSSERRKLPGYSGTVLQCCA